MKTINNEDIQYQDFERRYYELNNYYCRNYRLNNSKSLVELWVKSLCTYLMQKEFLLDSEFRTDKCSDVWLKTISEGEMCHAQSIMSEIESIWKSLGGKG